LKITKVGNKKPRIDEGQTTQWPKEKEKEKDKRRSTEHYTEN
jgi:hypothetical protein